MKGTIVGKYIKPYVDKTTGEVKTLRTLHVVCDAPKHLQDGFEGQSVEIVKVPFELPEEIKLNSRCEFEFEVAQSAKGGYKYLVDIEHIEKMAVSIKPITDAPNK